MPETTHSQLVKINGETLMKLIALVLEGAERLPKPAKHKFAELFQSLIDNDQLFVQLTHANLDSSKNEVTIELFPTLSFIDLAGAVFTGDVDGLLVERTHSSETNLSVKL